MAKDAGYFLAHLSDLHLTADDGDRRYGERARGMNANLRQLLKHRQICEADAVLVTGDVTDRGDSQAWEHFWQAAAHLDRDRLLVIPGNHDVCCLGVRRRHPLTAHLAAAATGLALGGQPSQFPWVRRIGDGSVALFAIDSVKADNRGLLDNAVGHLGFDQLLKLARLLEAHADARCKLVLLHHSPNIPARNTSRRRAETPLPFWQRPLMQLDPRDRYALRLLARSHGVKALVHGHTHDHLDRRVNSVRILGTRDATVADARGELSFKVYRLAPESGRLSAQVIRTPAVR